MARKRKKKRTTDGGDELDALFRALGHPLRRNVLRLIMSEEELSPVEASRLMNEPLSTISYHFRVLSSTGAVELVQTLPRRGSVQHFYSATEIVKKTVGSWLMLPPDCDPA
jgi:DNA-binding transcriptional ArsR family regulator